MQLNQQNLVKNGYLGNYKTVSISKVLETNFKGCEIKWDNFETTDEKNIVEVFIKNPTLDKTLKIQFSLNKDDTFEVVHVSVDGEAFKTPYESKVFLDALYESYAEIASDYSVVADYETSNDTLKGGKLSSLKSDNKSSNKNTTASSVLKNESNSKNQDTKPSIDLMKYLRVSIDVVKEELGPPNRISGVQASRLYDYGTFYFLVDDNKVSYICITGSGANISDIEVGMFPQDVRDIRKNPTRQINGDQFIMDYRLNSDSTSIKYYCTAPDGCITQITVADLTVFPDEY